MSASTTQSKNKLVESQLVDEHATVVESEVVTVVEGVDDIVQPSAPPKSNRII
jgi:hypothetical protein